MLFYAVLCCLFLCPVAVFYRDLEEIMEERGVKVDHATLNRLVIRYSFSFALVAKKCKRNVTTSWRMDETTIKIKEKWGYLYRAIDKFGDTIDGIETAHRIQKGQLSEEHIPAYK